VVRERGGDEFAGGDLFNDEVAGFECSAVGLLDLLGGPAGEAGGIHEGDVGCFVGGRVLAEAVAGGEELGRVGDGGVGSEGHVELSGGEGVRGGGRFQGPGAGVGDFDPGVVFGFGELGAEAGEGHVEGGVDVDGGGLEAAGGLEEVVEDEVVAATVTGALGGGEESLGLLGQEVVFEGGEGVPGGGIAVEGAEPDAIGFAVGAGGFVGAVGALELVVGHGVGAVGEEVEAELDEAGVGEFAEGEVVLVFEGLTGGVGVSGA
jgi:hypothetical protein